MPFARSTSDCNAVMRRLRHKTSAVVFCGSGNGEGVWGRDIAGIRTKVFLESIYTQTDKRKFQQPKDTNNKGVELPSSECDPLGSWPMLASKRSSSVWNFLYVVWANYYWPTIPKTCMQQVLEGFRRGDRAHQPRETIPIIVRRTVMYMNQSHVDGADQVNFEG